MCRFVRSADINLAVANRADASPTDEQQQQQLTDRTDVMVPVPPMPTSCVGAYGAKRVVGFFVFFAVCGYRRCLGGIASLLNVDSADGGAASLRP